MVLVKFLFLYEINGLSIFEAAGATKRQLTKRISSKKRKKIRRAYEEYLSIKVKT